MLENVSNVNIIMALMLIIVLILIGYISIYSRRVSYQFFAFQRSLDISSRAMTQSLKNVGEVGETVKRCHQNGLETLRFQKVAHDRERVMIASLNKQLIDITAMLDRDKSDSSPGAGSDVSIQRPLLSEEVIRGVGDDHISRFPNGKLFGMDGAPDVGVLTLEEWFAKNRVSTHAVEETRKSNDGSRDIKSQSNLVNVSSIRLNAENEFEEGRYVANG